MDIECVCGQFHNLSQTDLVLVVTAYQDGDLIAVNGREIRCLCMLTAFTPDNIKAIQKKYPKRLVTIPAEQ